MSSTPELRPIPAEVQGFRIRVDLSHTKPPVWRTFDVRGDITLPRLHDLLQATMGWTDSHLHRFRTGNGRYAQEFLTQFDIDEGEEGVPEDEVRLDQIVAAVGDRLWYDYDFGDGWEHVLRVQKVLEEPPESPRCIAGKRACPPEDCGGVWGYSELAEWVSSDFDDALRPDVFASREEGIEWLPAGWHPDAFDVDETNELIEAVMADPPPLVEELSTLLDDMGPRDRDLRDILALPVFHEPTVFHDLTEVSDADAAALVNPFVLFLNAIGDSAPLTAAGYLQPSVVEQVSADTGIASWWIGKANREDHTLPVAELRDSAQKLGLVSVRKGYISPTQAAKRCQHDPRALLQHIVQRLPLGTARADREAGWVALIVAGAEVPVEMWPAMISALMFGLGWRDGDDRHRAPSAESPTLTVLRILAGTLSSGELRGVQQPVAALARSVVVA